MIELVLDEQQQELAEKNHNLILWYTNSHRLDLEEYYGELAIELCKAAYHYNKSTGISFTTFATKCMDNRMKQLFRKRERTIEGIEDILSLDYPYSTDGLDSCTLSDCIADNAENVEKESLINIETERFINTLSDRDKYIFKCIMNGETQISLSEKLGISSQRVGKIVERIRKKWDSSVRASLY